MAETETFIKTMEQEQPKQDENIQLTEQAQPPQPDNAEQQQEQQQTQSTADDETVVKTNPPSKGKSKRRSIESALSLEDELAKTKEQLLLEKEGKRKLFNALVKLANELRRSQSESKPLMRHNDYANKAWYDGGMWRAPRVLPGVESRTQKRTRLREAISLSDLFFNLVIVTAFTRVGMAVSERNQIDLSSFLYFAVFWNVWNKEASYSSRFDTTDLSAQVEALVTCFATLFGSLSTMQPLDSPDSNRVIIMAAFVAVLHMLLHMRVAYWNRNALPGTLEEHVRQYAMFNVGMNLLEAAIWVTGTLAVPVDGKYRWAIFVGGIMAALRVPRAFLANDFHGTTCRMPFTATFVPWRPFLTYFNRLFTSESCVFQTRSSLYFIARFYATECGCCRKSFLPIPIAHSRSMWLHWRFLPVAILH